MPDVVQTQGRERRQRNPKQTFEYIHTKATYRQVVNYQGNTETPLITTLGCLKPEMQSSSMHCKGSEKASGMTGAEQHATV